jgi:hypothetical protein
MTSRALVATATLLTLVACRAPADESVPEGMQVGAPAPLDRAELRPAERRRADLAEEVVHDEARTVERTLRELSEASAGEQRDREEFSSEVSWERRRYRRILLREVGWLERQVIQLQREVAVSDGPDRDEHEIDLAAAREWRTRLKQNLEALERTGKVAWPALKEKIQRDLDEDRPEHVPLSYDEAYEI